MLSVEIGMTVLAMFLLSTLLSASTSGIASAGSESSVIEFRMTPLVGSMGTFSVVRLGMQLSVFLLF